MRTHTVAQRTAIASRRKRVWVKSEVENAGGAMISFMALSGRNWFHSARWKKTADAPNWEGTVTFIRESGGVSLAPEVSGSPLNAGAPAIDGMRRVRLSTAVMLPGVAAVPADYTEVFDGYITEPDWGGRDEGLIRCAVRDKYALLMAQMTTFGYVYGSPTGMPMEDALQQLLDDHPNPKLGAVTLWLPNGPPLPGGFPVMQTERTLDVGPVLLSMRNIADQIGWTVGPLYDNTNTLRLAFYRADRTKAAPDDSLALSEIFEIGSYSVPTDDIRNDVEVGFIDRATGVSMSTRTNDPTSVGRYGPRYMRIQEEWTNNIDTLAEAILMRDAALSDLKAPYAVQRTQLGYNWTLEVGDLLGMPANAVIYDTPRNQAVVEVEHGLEDGVAETVIATRAQVVGAYKNWLEKEGNNGQQQDQAPEVTLVSATQVSATTADVVIEIATFNGEAASVVISNSPGGGTAWNLVTANGDPTPRYVTDGTQLGPADWFFDGTTYAQVLGAIVLDPVLPTVLYAQATGRSSDLASAWLPISIAGAQTTGTQNGGATARGTSVNVIIPVLLTDPAASPSVIAAGQDDAFSSFSYNPAPFTQIRLDAEVINVGGVGATLQLQQLVAAVWTPVAGCTVAVDAVGLIRGASVPNTIITESWFRVVPLGDCELKSAWVSFLPRALSIPPSPWTPPLIPAVCNSSLSGLQDWGEDWCGYATDDEALLAYRWAQYPSSFGPWWSDYNEPVGDIEGMDVGLYDNVSMPFAPDYKRDHIVRGLPFNGGSTAIEFDSAVIIAEMGGTIHGTSVTNYRGMRNNVPVNVLGGSMPQAKVTIVARVWIDGTTDFSTSGNFVEPVYVGWSSLGAFGECRAVISRYGIIDYGTPRLLLVVYSYNTANTYEYDCGPAAALIGYAPGHEFKLEAQIIPATNSAYDKMQARLSVRRLPGGGAGGMEGQWIIRNQNLLNGGGFWVGDITWFWCNRNGAGYVHAQCYSIEQWFGDKIWLGEPALIDTQDVTPAPNDNSAVTTALSTTDPFNARPPGRPGIPSSQCALPAPWVRFNDGGLITSLIKDTTGHAVLSIDPDGSGTIRGAKVACPQLVADHYYQLVVTAAAVADSGSGVFLYYEESATGKWVAYGIHNNGTNRRMSVRTSAGGEIFRGATDITATAINLIMEHFGANFVFEKKIAGVLTTDTTVAVSGLFTTGPDRVGIAGMSGAAGATTLTFDALGFDN